ncbi:hypothetical protein F5Y08DRAFT_351968 [Xylaria arbuscula]|nr:hypothetical protein F5Y08DRAFT_351968 [Xylaria arbuscula]
MSNQSDPTGPSSDNPPTSSLAGTAGTAPSITPSQAFARPPPDFDPEQAKAEFLKTAGKSFLDPRDEVEESVEDEIQRKISELEKAKDGPVAAEEKEKIARKVRFLREGAWLEGLKLELTGRDAVPIEYFNRIVAENEDSIRKVAQINSKAERELAKKDAQIKDLKTSSGQSIKLQDELTKSEQRGDALEIEVRKLKVELDRKNAKPKETAAEKDALTKCKRQVAELQKSLKAANGDLVNARDTLSKRHEEVESLKQQKADGREREDGLKAQARDLMNQIKERTDASNQSSALQKQIDQSKLERADCQAKIAALEGENKKLKDAAEAQKEPDDLHKRIAELEAGWAECKDKVKALEDENKSLKNASQGSSAEPNNTGDLGDLQKQIARLEVKIMKRDESITALQTQLKHKYAGLPKGSPSELQAHCITLRNSRDTYRNRWARGVTANSANLLMFWEAVESTNLEIKKLYDGVRRLGNALGLTGEVLDTPDAIDKILAKVSEQLSAEVDEHGTPQISILHLLTANTNAKVIIETLMRELDKARIGKSPDETKVQLRVVEEETVEQRVSTRTQTYRGHRGSIINHIYQAQSEFLQLADRSADKDAIKALVNRFLQPYSLPRAELARNDPTGR